MKAIAIAFIIGDIVIPDALVFTADHLGAAWDARLIPQDGWTGECEGRGCIRAEMEISFTNSALLSIPWNPLTRASERSFSSPVPQISLPLPPTSGGINVLFFDLREFPPRGDQYNVPWRLLNIKTPLGWSILNFIHGIFRWRWAYE